MKKKNLIIVFTILILCQIFLLAISNNKSPIGYEYAKVSEEFEKENPGVTQKTQNSSDKEQEEKLITEMAKRMYVEESLRRLKDSKIRNFISSVNSEEKELLIQNESTKLNILKDSEPNSYKIIELEHEIEIMKKGYNPINFIMEKVLNLNSHEFLKNQKNYFFMFLTIFLLLLLFVTNFLKSKTNKQF